MFDWRTTRVFPLPMDHAGYAGEPAGPRARGSWSPARGTPLCATTWRRVQASRPRDRRRSSPGHRLAELAPGPGRRTGARPRHRVERCRPSTRRCRLRPVRRAALDAAPPTAVRASRESPLARVVRGVRAGHYAGNPRIPHPISCRRPGAGSAWSQARFGLRPSPDWGDRAAGRLCIINYNASAVSTSAGRRRRSTVPFAEVSWWTTPPPRQRGAAAAVPPQSRCWRRAERRPRRRQRRFPGAPHDLILFIDNRRARLCRSLRDAWEGTAYWWRNPGCSTPTGRTRSVRRRRLPRPQSHAAAAPRAEGVRYGGRRGADAVW
jgi:hypothetical protein